MTWACRSRLLMLSVAIVTLCGYFYSVSALSRVPRNTPLVEMQTALPRFAQIAMAGGDRYLAANLAFFRVLVASTEKMQAENFHIQGIVQRDVAWLNPAHEDNYYIAAAVLPWSNEYEAAQEILAQAAAARPFDYSPAFFYGFNAMYFKRDIYDGARWLRRASEQTRMEDERLMLQQMAAKWMDRGDDPALAASIVAAMAEHARPKNFQNYLLKRVARLKALAQLRKDVARYVEQYGTSPMKLEDLVSARLVTELPSDPFGKGFVLDAAGNVVFAPIGLEMDKKPD